jgi:hypothetical protein
MARAFWVPFFLSLVQAGQPVAAAPCAPPATVVERMDAYFLAPRSPATYRALAGLGDPLILPFNYHSILPFAQPTGEREWEKTEALVRRMLPPQRQDTGHWLGRQGDCRLGYALDTARARVAALGENHPYVSQWFAVQRAVFSACISREWSAPAALPPPLALRDAALARLQSDDRAYQAAARLFYLKSPAADRAFRRIADSRSPHAPIARYMRLVLLAEAKAPSAAAIVAEAERILADPRLAAIHPMTQGFIGSAGYRSAHDWSGERFRPLAPELRRAQVRLTLEALRIPIERLRSDPVARELYARALDDVDHLHDEFPNPDWWLTRFIPEDSHASRAMAEAAKTDRFAGWLLFPKSPFRAGAWGRAQRELERDWHSRLGWYADAGDRDRDALAWQVIDSSTTTVPGGWGQVDEMAEEAARCADDRRLAALPELFYHQVRRSLMAGRWPGRERDRLFAEALDEMAAWRWKDSEHYREAVAAALRYLIEVGRIGEARRLRDRLILDPPAGGGRFDLPLLLLAEDEPRFVRALGGEEAAERASLLNLLGTGALHRLAARGDVAAGDRARFARTAWTRTYALGRPVPGRLDRLMRLLNPEIAAGWSSRPGKGGPGDRRLLLDVLRSPGLNILMTPHQRPGGEWDEDRPGLNGIDTFQHSDNNWWCAWQPGRHESRLDEILHREFFSGPGEHDPDPLEVAGARRVLVPLLESSWLWNRRDGAEEKALTAIDCAPKLLAGRAIAWASGRGGGGRGRDEALALAVRATRYGCQRQGGHGAYSRAAYTLLHRLFPRSPAARRTPYWFDCSHFSGGCPPRDPPDLRSPA